MSEKISIIEKIIICTLFCLLLINVNKASATDLDTKIERGYFEEVETDEGIFYKEKRFDKNNSHIPYPSSGYELKDKEIYIKISNIINEELKEYMKKYTSEECSEDKRIDNEFQASLVDLLCDYSNYTKNEDISLIAGVYAEPINGDSDYWKQNFSSNELYYDKFEKKYSVIMYYFIRLSKSLETGEYEIAYIDLKPENYDKYVEEFKNTKGVDLENLDIEKILNIDYSDEITAIPSSNTVTFNANKPEYRSAQTEQISNMAFVIRIICIAILTIFIVIYAIKSFIKKKNNKIY